jgi:hypothetical protein
MVVAGQLLRELEPGQPAPARETVHDTRLLEHGEVPVEAALGHPAGAGEDLLRRQRLARRREQVDERAPLSGVPTVAAGEAGGRGGVDVRGHGRSVGASG